MIKVKLKRVSTADFDQLKLPITVVANVTHTRKWNNWENGADEWRKLEKAACRGRGGGEGGEGGGGRS